MDIYVITNGSAIRTAVIFFYICNERVSILENTAKIGLLIPKSLKNILEQLSKEDGTMRYLFYKRKNPEFYYSDSEKCYMQKYSDLSEVFKISLEEAARERTDTFNREGNV